MPKKSGPSSFDFFVQEWRTRQESRGRTFSSLQDVRRDQEMIKEWQTLSVPEKSCFIAMAKGNKISAQKTVKWTTLGESINDIEQNQIDEVKFKQTMDEYIKTLLSTADKNNCLQTQKFYFIHVNWFYIRKHDNYVEYKPAEFAIAEFSLGKGVQNVYHELVNSKAAIGFTREAIETSQSTHQIPLELSEGKSDYSVMLNKLKNFFDADLCGNKYPPLYTTKDVREAVLSLLDEMCNASNEDVQNFLVYSIESLFSSLMNLGMQKCVPQYFPLPAEHQFAKDYFAYQSNIECKFHRNIDGTSRYCSMSIVKRWGFTICDACCESLNIPLVPGLNFIESSRSTNIQNDMKKLSIASGRSNTVLSMTGVSEEHRQKTSERTEEQERRRRLESKPLNIIDHSKIDYSKIVEKLPPHRPAVPVHQSNTRSFATLLSTEEAELEVNDNNFPTVGGTGLNKKRTKHSKYTKGIGRGAGC